MITDAENVKGK